jgi:hypothetical protein
MRYIDADELRKESKMLYSIHAFEPVEAYTQDQIDNAPTVDLVPAPVKCVRCKCNEGDTGNANYLYCRHLHAYVPVDFGCIQGKRKDDAK